MLSTQTIREALSVALSMGGDFAELFYEKKESDTLSYVDGKIEKSLSRLSTGVGIRVFNGVQTYYAATSGDGAEDVLSVARQVAQSVGLTAQKIDFALPSDYAFKTLPTADAEARVGTLTDACVGAKKYDAHIVQVSGRLLCENRHILVANSEGLLRTDDTPRIRLAVTSVAERNGEKQTGFNGPGTGLGVQWFNTLNPAEVGAEASREAIVNLYAKPCPAGQMTVAIDNGFGGVIFHEACGHSLEATSVAIGMSQMAGKMGQKIASDKVTAIDDGTLVGAWGSSAVDDEGLPTQKNVLIENGVLKNYLVDRLGARRMGLPANGCGRRQSYTFEPTSRMTNTYIAPGTDRNEDIIASIDNGLYCAKMGGGSVNPLTGEFNFAVNEGYLVKNGKITDAVRGASLIGSGDDILMKIDMVGSDCARAQGMCGSSSGSIPVEVGQPMIRVSSMTVGGQIHD